MGGQAARVGGLAVLSVAAQHGGGARPARMLGASRLLGLLGGRWHTRASDRGASRADQRLRAGVLCLPPALRALLHYHHAGFPLSALVAQADAGAHRVRRRWRRQCYGSCGDAGEERSAAAPGVSHGAVA